MKQAYMAPEMEVIEMNIDSPDGPFGSRLSRWTQIGGPASGKEADANGRRGSWGNLWDSGSSQVSNRRW